MCGIFGLVFVADELEAVLERRDVRRLIRSVRARVLAHHSCTASTHWLDGIVAGSVDCAARRL